jgi:hypothetical protein
MSSFEHVMRSCKRRAVSTPGKGKQKPQVPALSPADTFGHRQSIRREKADPSPPFAKSATGFGMTARELKAGGKT